MTSSADANGVVLYKKHVFWIVKLKYTLYYLHLCVLFLSVATRISENAKSMFSGLFIFHDSRKTEIIYIFWDLLLLTFFRESLEASVHILRKAVLRNISSQKGVFIKHKIRLLGKFTKKFLPWNLLSWKIT